MSAATLSAAGFAAMGFKNFVSDPEVPAILKEAGHVGKPQAAIFGGKFGS